MHDNLLTTNLGMSMQIHIFLNNCKQNSCRSVNIITNTLFKYFFVLGTLCVFLHILISRKCRNIHSIFTTNYHKIYFDATYM